MNEQLSLFGSGPVVDVKHSEQFEENDDRDNEYYGILYGDNMDVITTSGNGKEQTMKPRRRNDGA